jgi:hypothetical protein
VKADTLEAEFVRLLEGLSIHPDQLTSMSELGIQMSGIVHVNDDIAVEAEKRAAIARLNRKKNNNLYLLKQGEISIEEYKAIADECDRELAHWEARTTEKAKIAVELAVAAEAFTKITTMWETSSDEDKQGLARTLFQYIVFDLDTHRIVDFRLKSWADRYMTLRTALYDNENGLEPDYSVQGQDTDVTLTGNEHIRFSLSSVVKWLLKHCGITREKMPKNRNERIRERYALGEALSELAREFGISPQRVYQIVQGKNH